MLLQTDMNSINNDWDSTKRAETLDFHFCPSSQNKKERKEPQNENVEEKRTNIHPFIHTPTFTKTYINTDTHTCIYAYAYVCITYCTSEIVLFDVMVKSV